MTKPKTDFVPAMRHIAITKGYLIEAVKRYGPEVLALKDGTLPYPTTEAALEAVMADPREVFSCKNHNKRGECICGNDGKGESRD